MLKNGESSHLNAETCSKRKDIMLKSQTSCSKYRCHAENRLAENTEMSCWKYRDHAEN